MIFHFIYSNLIINKTAKEQEQVFQNMKETKYCIGDKSIKTNARGQFYYRFNLDHGMDTYLVYSLVYVGCDYSCMPELGQLFSSPMPFNGGVAKLPLKLSMG